MDRAGWSTAHVKQKTFRRAVERREDRVRLAAANAFRHSLARLQRSDWDACVSRKDSWFRGFGRSRADSKDTEDESESYLEELESVLAVESTDQLKALFGRRAAVVRRGVVGRRG
ncbi:unnamed protein product [Bursaphelenchus okinawaensis]|uniref:Uncharacterized protein n=1 Tax=Bursaphelenchus okinawaensis TaxID=465554 RepID=A0A811KIV9_9BILA|nr:unnamed protein product [Bursaphelenchus okinawaensis]CAG9103750.1 unnamed protein product [Bursaphelenchus okinawaensis]